MVLAEKKCTRPSDAKALHTVGSAGHETALLSVPNWQEDEDDEEGSLKKTQAGATF